MGSNAGYLPREKGDRGSRNRTNRDTNAPTVADRLQPSPSPTGEDGTARELVADTLRAEPSPDSTETVTQIPQPGDDDYLDWLDEAKASGHVTDEQRRELRLEHLALRGADIEQDIPFTQKEDA